MHSLGESDGACQILTSFDCNLDMGLQCVSQNFWQTVSEVHHELSNLIMKLSSKSRTWERRQYDVTFEVRKLRVSQAHKYKQVAFEIELIFYNGTDLSNWMEIFEDKMDDKSYQLIFETNAANQFTSRLQLLPDHWIWGPFRQVTATSAGSWKSVFGTGRVSMCMPQRQSLGFL